MGGVEVIETEKALLEFLGEQHKRFGGMKLAEQAVPSYLHSNPLVSSTFWRRIRTAIAICRQNRRVGNLLDFGSGTGIILPFLTEGDGQKIYAVEPEAHAREILASVKDKFELRNLQIHQSLSELRGLPPSSIDTVTALDVFEHIEKLEDILTELKRLMSPGALLVVSSPTESWYYKFARRFGGPEYTGHYHVSNAAQVEAQLARFFDVELVKRLYPGLVFFRIVRCKKH